MKEIVVATTNKGKLKEISAMLEKLGIEVKSIKDVLGYNPDIEETGTTFTENAVIKAETVMNMIHMPTLADDSGLEVDALDKQPGIYSSRFMGEDTSYDIKNKYIIDKYIKEYMNWLNLRCVTNYIKKINDSGDFIVSHRVKSFENKCKNKEDAKLAEILIKSTADYYINRAIKVLKNEKAMGREEQCLRILMEIFTKK